MWTKDKERNQAPNESKKKRMKTFAILPLIIGSACFIIMGCSNLYEGNNLVYLDYPVETSLRSSIVQAYCDTLIKRYGYNVPKKWSHQNKLVELDSISHIRIYFKNNPEEMYLISFGGMIILDDVYNLKIRDGQWVARRDSMTKKEEARVKQRFKTEILDNIEVMAKRDKIPDSLIYKQ